jgi:hypothetical protein
MLSVPCGFRVSPAVELSESRARAADSRVRRAPVRRVRAAGGGGVHSSRGHVPLRCAGRVSDSCVRLRRGAAQTLLTLRNSEGGRVSLRGGALLWLRSGSTNLASATRLSRNTSWPRLPWLCGLRSRVVCLYRLSFKRRRKGLFRSLSEPRRLTVEGEPRPSLPLTGRAAQAILPRKL